MEFIIAKHPDEYLAAANLFNEYANWLGIDLGFQHFEEEIKNVEKMYNAEDGGIILCKENNAYLGCVALRRINDSIAELKRMYVQPAYQHKGIGQNLLHHAFQLAQHCNYKFIRLDTLDNMLPAIRLYEKHGFYQIPAYYHNPNSNAVYFERQMW